MLKVVLTVILTISIGFAPSAARADTAAHRERKEIKLMLKDLSVEELALFKEVLRNYLTAEPASAAKVDPAAATIARPEPVMATTAAVTTVRPTTTRSSTNTDAKDVELTTGW